MAKKIGIIGLGLMGGSLSMALRQCSDDFTFIGLDHNKAHAREALSLGLVDEVVEQLDEITHCDILILTIPVDGIIAISQTLKNVDKNCTIIDFGSTKEKISNAIPETLRKNFVTAHPMTGTEKFGPSAALPDLYLDKVVVLCDMEKSGKHQQEVATKLFYDIGMKLVFMDAKEHDRHAAFISHMPHALSFALANTVLQQEEAKSIIDLAGGGFRDMSRIAKSSPGMWEDIFRQNKSNLLEAINTLQSELKKCEKMVTNNEWKALNEWMQRANKLHDIL